MASVGAMAQGTVKGKVLDRATNEPLEFINVAVTKRGDTKILTGAITDATGSFQILDIPVGEYTLTASF